MKETKFDHMVKNSFLILALFKKERAGYLALRTLLNPLYILQMVNMQQYKQDKKFLNEIQRAALIFLLNQVKAWFVKIRTAFN